MEDILVPLGLFAMVVAIVAINVAGSASRRKAVLSTIQEAIRSGQEMTPETIKALGVQEKPKGGDLKSGSILIAVAAALLVMGWTIQTTSADDEVFAIMTAIAAFPGFIGVVLIAFGLFANKKQDQA